MKTKQFGDRLAQERRHKSVAEWRDVFRKDIAKDVGVSESALGRWELNANMPSDEIIARLAAYFGVTSAWLRYGTEPREPVDRLIPRPKSARESKSGGR